MTDRSITIACPSCAFCNDYPFERLPPKAVIVTCPKCRQQFPFSEHVQYFTAKTGSNVSEKNRDITKAVTPPLETPPPPSLTPSQKKKPTRAAIPIASQKPKKWLVVAGGVVLSGSSVFLFAIGDYASGCFPLFLALFIVGIYLYYRSNPFLEDAEYLRTTAAVIVKTAFRHGRASQEDIEAVKEAEKNARKRYAHAKANLGNADGSRPEK